MVSRETLPHGLTGKLALSMTQTCRSGCGACCIAPSISSPIPGMPVYNGISKPAGVRCVQLDDEQRCRLFGQPERPAVCSQLQPSAEMSGHSTAEAMIWLTRLEALTAPPTTPTKGP